MKLFRLVVGLVVCRGEQSFQLERHLEDGTLVFVNRLNGRPMTLTVGDFWEKINKKWMVVNSGVEPGIGQKIENLSDLVYSMDSFEEKYRNESNRRLKYIQAVRRAGLSKGMRKQIDDQIKIVAMTSDEKSPPSSSTVMRWLRDLEKAQQNPLALMSRHATSTRSKRLPEKALDIAREVLRTHYCKLGRPSLESSLLEANKQIALQMKMGEAPKNGSAMSSSTFRRLKNEIDPYAIDLSRYGQAYTKNKWRYSLSGPNSVRALQRYEVDHTIVDLVCVCDQTGLPLGRPTLTIVVDAFSGYVVGLYVSFWGTGLAPTFRALQVAFGPKDEFNKILDPAKPWLGYGLCELLALDNGLEFHSPQFKMMASQLCIDIQYCAVRQPWLKPFVERALGTYLEYLPKSGRVRRALNNELPEKPDKTASITFSSLCDGLLRAFTGIHAYEINERKLSRPVDLFGESFDGLPPVLLPTDLDTLEIIVSPSKNLTVGNEGIVTDYLRFNSKELQEIRRGTGVKYKTTVKFNPDDLGYVWVQDLKSLAWILVPSVNPEYSNGLSVVQHKAIREHAKNMLRQKNASEILLKSKLELADLWSSRAVQGKRLKKEHLRAMSGMTSRKVLLGKEAQSGLPKIDKFVSVEELNFAVDNIPDFESFSMY